MERTICTSSSCQVVNSLFKIIMLAFHYFSSFANKALTERVQHLCDIKRIMMHITQSFAKHIHESKVDVVTWTKFVETISAWRVNGIPGNNVAIFNSNCQ